MFLAHPPCVRRASVTGWSQSNESCAPTSSRNAEAQRTIRDRLGLTLSIWITNPLIVRPRAAWETSPAMMSTGRFVASLAFLLIAGTTANAQKVTVEYDKSVDFSKFQTYAWAKGAQAKDASIDRHIIEAIDWRLNASGLQRVDGTGDPDLVVVYYAATDDRLQINPSNLGGWGPGWGWATGSTVVAPLENIRDGDLAVAIAIVRTKRFIWTGSASGSMSGGARRVQKRLDGSLDKMFQKFPLRPQT